MIRFPKSQVISSWLVLILVGALGWETGEAWFDCTGTGLAAVPAVVADGVRGGQCLINGYPMASSSIKLCTGCGYPTGGTCYTQVIGTNKDSNTFSIMCGFNCFQSYFDYCN
jgi:hypothetical protein